MKDTPRVAYLKKAIAYNKRLLKIPNLQGNRPYVAVQMMIEVLEAELNRAQSGKPPMYKAQSYSDLSNETKVWS